MARMRNEDRLAGQLPGTGGDFIDTEDTEGHRMISRADGEGVESGATDTEPGLNVPDVDGDVEGHKVSKFDGGERAEGDAADGDPGLKFPDVEGDVEGHRASIATRLYRGGPTTQGEIVVRGPNDNPHGD